MEGEESSETTRSRRELEKIVLDKVGHVISAVDEAKHADQVIVALYSLAVCLFPLHPSHISGSLDEKYREELCALEVPNADEKTQWWSVFYRGSSFRAFARVLLYDLAYNWLACFSASARKHVYDVFFINGCASEIVQVVVPCLHFSGSGGHDSNAVCLNAERLLVLLLLENDHVIQMAREFAGGYQCEDLSAEQLKQAISGVSQLITSIPDKARQGSPPSLSAQYPHSEL